MRKVVIGLSGGMDSATLLGHLLEQGAEVHCCTFYYGSKHGKWENRAAENIIDYYQNKRLPIFGYAFDLQAVFANLLSTSSLLNSGGDIPEGHYTDITMKSTVVPGRNMIFSSIMASLAESIGAQEVALGVHAGDHHIYPDCRPEFIGALDRAVYLSSDKTVEITTPFVNFTKLDILMAGKVHYKTEVPYHLTRTCYTDHEFSCGKCGSCVERLEAFSQYGMPDPITYQNQV